MKISIKLTLDEALELTRNIKDISNESELELDFSKVTRIEPFAMLVVSSQLRRLKQRNQECRLQCTGTGHLGYAGHMGFFKAFGENIGQAPGASSGSKRYIPIQILSTNQIRIDASDRGVEIGTEVESQSEAMSRMLCRESEGDSFNTLSYSIRELVRNVVEHSNSSQLGFCAQYWPSKNRVELAIIDRGMGLQESLLSNPHINPSNDKEAINYALMPAVSGKAYKGARKQKGPWANSGFGLYMTSRICRDGGSFLVASGNTAMLLTDRSEGKRYFDCNFKGTAIRMIIKTDRLSDLMKSLEKYRFEGFEIQKRYKEIVRIEPSAASLMLSKDFDLGLWDTLLKKVKGR